MFERATPLLEFLGYLILAGLLVSGAVRVDTTLLFFAIALGFGVLLSTLALLLEELSFHIYPRKRDLLILFACSVLENLGYRQINVVWRLIGTWQWLRGKQGGWGVMQRKGMETKKD